MDPIKEAFSKAKSDILDLKSQFASLSNDVLDLKELLSNIIRQINTQNSTLRQTSPTDNTTLNEPLANNPQFWAQEALKPHVYSLSTRNEGVPTDRQTNQQTDTTPDNPLISTGKPVQSSDISSLLDSLDSYKKDLRNKFKKLTKQEMLVYSTIYQLEEEGFVVDYPLIAKKLSLSESSIRDYVQRMTKKNIQIDKVRENNKKIYLSIPKDIRQIASLQTILQLREI